MASDPQFDDVNATTLKHIYPRVIQDNFFRNAPLLAYLRDHCLAPFGGGAFIQSTFLYQPTNGGAYAMGDTFDISAKQLFAGFTFDPKYYEQNVTVFSEQVNVLNRGSEAYFSILQGNLGAAMNTMSAQQNIDLYYHGQNLATSPTDANTRIKQLNGLAELANDGVTNSWQGGTFTTYGNQTRNGVIGDTANSIPYWNGDQSGNAQPIIYDTCELFYQAHCRGEEEPDLMWGNRGVYSYVKSRMQVQQRFMQEKDPYWGVSGFRFNNAMFLRDDYAPSASNRFGSSNASLGNWTTGTFTSASTVAAASNMPASTLCTVGEVMFIANTKKLIFEVTNDRLHGYGFTGFKVANDSTRYSGQILAACNLHGTAPWAVGQMFGISG